MLKLNIRTEKPNKQNNRTTHDTQRCCKKNSTATVRAYPWEMRKKIKEIFQYGNRYCLAPNES